MSDKPKIILTAPNPPKPRRYRLNGAVRVNEDAEIAVRELCDKTGLSIRHVASELIIQAAALCQIVTLDLDSRESE